MSLSPRKPRKALQHLGDLPPLPSTASSLKRALGAVVPVPGVLEGLDLRRGSVPFCSLEQHVVAGVGVEGRVEVDRGPRSRP